MAVSSNRSPSPSPVVGRSNPNPRNSEINNSVRRSFSGNPFAKPSIVANPRGFNPVTPANSPSDFLRRPSTGKDCVVPAHQNDKENDKDQIAKPARTRLPAVTKNFMSPTISAASKIAASPKKKVLLERNDPARASLSALSEGKSPCSSVNLQEAVEDETPASSDSTVVDPASTKKKASPSPSTAYQGNEVLDFQLPLKSKNDSEFLSEAITMESDCAGIDVCSKTRPTPSPSSASIRAPPDSDPSLPPYDPKTNYLSPRPQFLHYKPNPRIQKLRSTAQDVGSRESKRLEDRFTSEILSDTETNEESQSEDSSSVEMTEGENEKVEESEAAFAGTAQEPNVPEPDPIDVSTSKGVSSSYSFFRWKPIAFLLLLLVGCFWIGATDSPFIGSLVGKELSFTKLYEPAELAEFARTNLDVLISNLRLWSANTVSYLSKMISIVKESNESSFNRYGNFTDCSCCLVKKNQQNLQWPMKEPQGNLIKAFEKGEKASQVNPEFEEGRVTLQAEVVEPDNAELERKPVEYHIHTEPERGTLCFLESEEANLSFQPAVLESYNSEGQQIEEESSVGLLIDHEAQNIIAEKEQEAQVPLTSEIEPELLEAEKLQGENDQESHVAFQIDHGSQTTENEKEVRVPQVPEIEPEVPEAEEGHGEIELTSDAEAEPDGAAVENEKKVRVPQVHEIEPEVPEAEEGHSEIELTSDAEVEPAGAPFEPESSESEASTANSQSFKEQPYLSLKEKSPPVGILGISSLISILAVAAAFLIFAKQQKSPTPSAAATPMDHLLAKKLASSPSASEEEDTHQERLSSRNWPTEVDMAGVSCPSEVSSFQRSISSHSKTGAKEMGFVSEYSMDSVSGSKGVNEVQSQGTGRRKSNRRESLASSSEYSTGPTSYGSFTSYEKIHSKHGGGDEEVVTPVRRSSRIRNQLTSP